MLALATSVPVSCSWPQPPTGRLWRVHLRRACVSRASGLCKLCPDTGAGGSCSDASDRAGGAGKSPRALSEVSEQRPVPRGFPSDPCRPSVAGGPGSPHRGGGHRPRLHTRATKVSFRFVFKPQPCGMSKGRVPLLGVGMGGAGDRALEAGPQSAGRGLHSLRSPGVWASAVRTLSSPEPAGQRPVDAGGMLGTAEWRWPVGR